MTESSTIRPASKLAKLGFAGTPEFAATLLQGLISAGTKYPHYIPQVVFTQPDRPAGRRRKLTPSPVKQLALQQGIAVQQPKSLRTTKAQSLIAEHQLDCLIVAAYGLILPEVIINLPTRGCVNVHASMLPRWRGAAPVERAIMAGDKTTGVTIMQMDAGLDTGAMLITRECPINETTTGPALTSQLAELGIAALLEYLATWDQLKPEPQPEQGATYAKKITAADSLIDWSQPAQQIARQVRALCGRAPVTGFLADGTRLRLLDAELITTDLATSANATQTTSPGTLINTVPGQICVQTGEGILRIQSLALNRGKGNPMAAKAACNGYPSLFTAGQMLLPAPPVTDA